MKHLHYGSIVIAISDELARTFEVAAHEFMSAGRSTVWPVSGYRDDREEVSIQVAIGPGIPFAVTDTWLPDEREPSRHDSDSTAYIEGERASLEKEQLRDDAQNVLVYGHFENGLSGATGTWRFRGHPSVTGSQDPHAAVRSLNRAGIEVVGMTEGGTRDGRTGATLYIVGRHTSGLPE